MTTALAAAFIIYGFGGVGFAILAWPVVRERNRIRRQRYGQFVDAIHSGLVTNLKDLKMCEQLFNELPST